MAKKKASRKKSKGKAKSKKKAARKAVPAIPKGFHTLTPYMCLQDTAFAMAFYEKAFGAKEVMRLASPDGRVAHAEMRIGDSHVMMADEAPQAGARSPQTIGGCPITLHLSVKNADAFVAKAVAAGATLVRKVENQFYGHRSGMLSDPFGYAWMVATQVEVIPPKQMQKRWTKMMHAMAAPEAKA